MLVGRLSGTDARQARRETSGVRPGGPAIEEVLAAAEGRGFPPRGRSREAACGASPAELRQRLPRAARATSSTHRAPSTGICRNPPALTCPGSTACRRTWRLRHRPWRPRPSSPSRPSSPHSPAPRAGQIRGLRSERPPAACKGGSSVSRNGFRMIRPMMGSQVPSRKRGFHLHNPVGSSPHCVGSI